MSWTNWLSKGLDVAKVIAGPTPIGAIITVADSIVDETVKDKGINNDDVIDTLQVMLKSKWNDLTPLKVELIKDIINSDGNTKDDILDELGINNAVDSAFINKDRL
ncbi:hypothetical protein AMRN_1426 [Malaciobacter marinus]|uniref:Uncharacterized protein n=1 Tax=Malaciobacter marinus TaxID=505249 RepID=A0A347TKN4_9BACT|nr:hypothetical protein [Malaciobacter marinus]AXX87162.1 hypothetical protein AMRN_1426 [Malaciobacter marinus]PHO14825.1 hypothetical protein CPH92_09570 [Malaciobacter marinus]